MAGQRGVLILILAPIDAERHIEPLRDLLDTLLRPHDDGQQC
jgi:hypothetical protein